MSSISARELAAHFSPSRSSLQTFSARTRPTATPATCSLTAEQRSAIARKAVETRRANESKATTVRAEHSDLDARLTRAMAGDRTGALLHVAGICWAFVSRAAALEFARLRGFTVHEARR